MIFNITTMETILQVNFYEEFIKFEFVGLTPWQTDGFPAVIFMI